MKKRFFAVILAGIIISAVSVLAACTDPDDSTTNICSTLNSLVAQPQNQVTLTVGTTLNGEELSGTFTAVQESGGMRVTYSYEQFSTFEEGEDGYIIPDSYITTYQGTMLISDGKVVEQDGDAADIAIERITAAGVAFDEDNFSDVAASEGSFQAKVKSPSEFLQADVDCLEMNVYVRYTQESIVSLSIGYKSAMGAQVSIKYTFG